MLKLFLGSTLTTPIPDPPSEHDTPSNTLSTQTETPITFISSGYCTHLTPIQVRGKDLCVCVCVYGGGEFTHPECAHTTHTHTLTQSYSSHLLVLHNTCHCLPIHRQICTPLSHRRRCITETLARCRSISNDALPRFSASVFRHEDRSLNVYRVETEISVDCDGPLPKRDSECFESGPLITAKLPLASPLKKVESCSPRALLARGDHRKICFIV